MNRQTNKALDKKTDTVKKKRRIDVIYAPPETKTEPPLCESDVVTILYKANVKEAMINFLKTFLWSVTIYWWTDSTLIIPAVGAFMAVVLVWHIYRLKCNRNKFVFQYNHLKRLHTRNIMAIALASLILLAAIGLERHSTGFYFISVALIIIIATNVYRNMRVQITLSRFANYT